MLKVNQGASLDHLPLLPCLWVSMLEVVPPSHCSACCFRWGLGASSVFMVGLSENSVPLNPMVLLIIIPMKNGYFIGNINPTFSDKPMFLLLLVPNLLELLKNLFPSHPAIARSYARCRSVRTTVFLPQRQHHLRETMEDSMTMFGG